MVHLFYAASSLVRHFIVISEFKLELQSRNAWPWKLMDDLEKHCHCHHRAHFLYYVKPCASSQCHGLIPIWVTVRKRSIRVKIDDFLSHVTLKFTRWPWKIIGYLFYTTSSFVHHSEGEFKLELQTGNAQFASKSFFFVLCDLGIWRIT